MSELTRPTSAEQRVASVDGSPAQNSDQASMSEVEPESLAETESNTAESDKTSDEDESTELDLGLENTQSTAIDQRQNATEDSLKPVEQPTRATPKDQSTVTDETWELDLGLEDTQGTTAETQATGSESATLVVEQPKQKTAADQSTVADDRAAVGAQNDELDQAPWLKQSGPMLESQKAGVEQALADTTLPPNDQAKIVSELMRESSPQGKDAADLITRGHLKDAGNYENVLSDLKAKGNRNAATMELRHADDLYHAGHTDLVFSARPENGEPHYDVDVGTRVRDESGHDTGRFDWAYQLKATSINKVADRARDASRQLEDAPADHKVVLIDVHGSQAELTPRHVQRLEQQAQRAGIPQHLRFSDGTSRTFPKGARVYPSTES